MDKVKKEESNNNQTEYQNNIPDESKNNINKNKINEDSVKTPQKLLNKNNYLDSPESNPSKSNSQLIESAKSNLNELKEEKNFHNSRPLSSSNKHLNKNEKENKLCLNLSHLKNIKIKDFNEENFSYPREYNAETRKYGTKFYNYRYLKENVVEKDKEDFRKKKYFLLITIEKAIFYFNHNKYKECIELLLNEKLIKNNVEFGEFLFVINGFDKNIISKFLSDDKSTYDINTNEILDNYLNCIIMEFNDNSILETLKFFLCSFINPKNEIIEKFSNNYFNKFKNNQVFIKTYKSLEIFSTLIKNIILINNFFTGKEKNNIKIDQFCKNNKELDKKFCSTLYKEIQLHPIFCYDNYIQKFYKKLSYLVKENDENAILDKTSDIDSYYENILKDNPKREYNHHNIWFSYRKNLYSFNKEDEEILLNPIMFIKYVTNSTTSHPRVFALRENFTTLIWAKSLEGGKIKGNLHSLKIEDIIDIYLGVDNCEVMKKYLKPNNKEIEDEYNYLTVKTKTEIFVIKAEDINISFMWFKALKSLIFKYQLAKNKDKERINEMNNNKIEKGIQKIWNNCIYNKWTEYGRYLLYKKQNKLEYKKVLGQINKKERIKSDLIDDKMNFNFKKIIFFMNELKSKLIEEGKENNILDYNEFLFLYKIGIPCQCRHILWDCLIGNSCGITKDIYDYYSQQINEINFDLQKKDILEKIKNNKPLFENEEDELPNKIMSDMIKIEDLFINELYILQKTTSEILSKIYKLIHIFFLMRRDIPYNKNIINYAFVFILVFSDEYISFKNLYNFICSTNIIKYLIKDNDYIEKNIELFEFLMKKYIPKFYLHLKNLDIENELFSVFWFENLFIQTLNYKIILRIFDLFLIYGDELLFQIGLAIIKIEEEDLLNYPINEVFKILKRLPNKYDEELFFENLELINIHDDYNKYIVGNYLSDQLDFLCSE